MHSDHSALGKTKFPPIGAHRYDPKRIYISKIRSPKIYDDLIWKVCYPDYDHLPLDMKTFEKMLTEGQRREIRAYQTEVGSEFINKWNSAIKQITSELKTANIPVVLADHGDPNCCILAVYRGMYKHFMFHRQFNCWHACTHFTKEEIKTVEEASKDFGDMEFYVAPGMTTVYTCCIYTQEALNRFFQLFDGSYPIVSVSKL